MGKLKKFFKLLGPGFITGASDDDPSGIVTYMIAGARTGFGLLWTSFLTTPFMIGVQELCARIGMVTGKGIVGVLRVHYSRSLIMFLVFSLLTVNTVNIGADIGAMAASLNLVTGMPFVFLAFVVVLATVLLEVFVSYKTYAKYLKFLTLALFAYIAVAFLIQIPWGEVLRKLVVPQIHLNKEFLMTIVAVLGTTISPYLFFWQASEEVEEEIAIGRYAVRARKGATPGELRDMRADVSIGMVFSNLVMFFIMVVAAATFLPAGITNIETAEQAASLLRPLAGDAAYLLFTLGIVGTGLLALPVLAGSASYAFAEAFYWHEGLSKKFHQARGFYVVIIVSMFVGLIINFLGVNPMRMLFYAAVLNGIISPVLLLMIFVVGNDKKIMGKYASGVLSNLLTGVTFLLMFFAAVALIVLSFI